MLAEAWQVEAGDQGQVQAGCLKINSLRVQACNSINKMRTTMVINYRFAGKEKKVSTKIKRLILF